MGYYRNILIALDWNLPELIRGVNSYASHHPWLLDQTLVYNNSLTRYCSKGDGIIARCFSSYGGNIRDFVAGQSLPTVYLDRIPEGGGHLVRLNYEMAGEMTYNYLRSLCHSNFYTYGDDKASFFKTIISLINKDEFFHTHINHKYDNWQNERVHLEETLKEIHFPAVLLTIGGMSAHYIGKICQECGIKVPEQLSIMCMSLTDSKIEDPAQKITCVDMNLYEAGYKAAELLDRVLDKEIPEGESVSISIQPKSIIPRESTNAMAITLPELNRAVKYMEENYSHAITVEDVVQNSSSMSKRALETLFREQTGRTPGDILRQIRMKEASRFLREGNEKVSYIAVKSGYSSQACFSEAFRKYFGVSPGKYRKENKG